ncbi:hypothetical protein SISNIDRAFT_457922 [Sistotremastrum niveocremeum HHB9708]|uniref:Uncharacterized protein n=1 Tax=Sistotremastrum niveocremeum HHB9708 TaxID=1314777 RepID=A0A164RA10_9AGAM|nr:hypothetical protein SISNIDRAFT_457922 [Sistotremastrum niveocremeum HHB9708]
MTFSSPGPSGPPQPPSPARLIPSVPRATRPMPSASRLPVLSPPPSGVSGKPVKTHPSTPGPSRSKVLPERAQSNPPSSSVNQPKRRSITTPPPSTGPGNLKRIHAESPPSQSNHIRDKRARSEAPDAVQPTRAGSSSQTPSTSAGAGAASGLRFQKRLDQTSKARPQQNTNIPSASRPQPSTSRPSRSASLPPAETQNVGLLPAFDFTMRAPTAVKPPSRGLQVTDHTSSGSSRIAEAGNIAANPGRSKLVRQQVVEVRQVAPESTSQQEHVGGEVSGSGGLRGAIFESTTVARRIVNPYEDGERQGSSTVTPGNAVTSTVIDHTTSSPDLDPTLAHIFSPRPLGSIAATTGSNKPEPRRSNRRLAGHPAQ